jgi:hypothetical protein
MAWYADGEWRGANGQRRTAIGQVRPVASGQPAGGAPGAGGAGDGNPVVFSTTPDAGRAADGATNHEAARLLAVCPCGWQGSVLALVVHAREEHGREAVARLVGGGAES